MLSHQIQEKVHTATGDDETIDTSGDVFEPQPVPVSPPPAASQFAAALVDLIKGARSFHLWGLLGWQDIRRRYRRSIIGPFWLTISMGVLVAVLSILYGALLRVEIADYAPFLALGFIVWTLISGFISEGCVAFTGAESIIKQVDLPLSVHVYRVVWRNLIIFFHNAAIFIVVAIIFSIWPGWVGLLALPGLGLLCLNGRLDGVVVRSYLGPLPRRATYHGQYCADRLLRNANHLDARVIAPPCRVPGFQSVLSLCGIGAGAIAGTGAGICLLARSFGHDAWWLACGIGYVP